MHTLALTSGEANDGVTVGLESTSNVFWVGKDIYASFHDAEVPLLAGIHDIHLKDASLLGLVALLQLADVDAAIRQSLRRLPRL